jgi:GNAT superfamily N-acetyltransferase
MREAYDRHERVRSVWPGVRRVVTPHLVRHLSEDGPHAWIAWSDLGRLPPVEIDAIIASERLRFARSRRPLEWKAYAHDRPHDLVARLASAGFVPGDPETLLAVDLAVGVPEAPGEVTIRRGAEALDAAGEVYQRVWPEQTAEVLARLRRTFERAPAAQDLVVVELDGAPASAGWTTYSTGSPFACLWGGATVPEARGRGLYRAVVAARLAEARARGAALAAVDAGPMSRPILERFGFVALSEITPCVAVPAGV